MAISYFAIFELVFLVAGIICLITKKKRAGVTLIVLAVALYLITLLGF